MVGAMLAGILLGIAIGAARNVYGTDTPHIIQVVEASEPQEVRIEVIIDWTPERIKQEIRSTFPEDPETAVKIAQCESGLNPTIQSNHTWRGERERSFGLFQVHSDSWDTKAKQLGLPDYRTDVIQNIQMARYIYDNAGKRWTDWSCYTKRMI